MVFEEGVTCLEVVESAEEIVLVGHHWRQLYRISFAALSECSNDGSPDMVEAISQPGPDSSRVYGCHVRIDCCLTPTRFENSILCSLLQAVPVPVLDGML